MKVCAAFNKSNKEFYHITLPYLVEEGLVEALVPVKDKK